jgi:hypothetical protein
VHATASCGRDHCRRLIYLDCHVRALTDCWTSPCVHMRRRRTKRGRLRMAFTQQHLRYPGWLGSKASRSRLPHTKATRLRSRRPASQFRQRQLFKHPSAKGRRRRATRMTTRASKMRTTARRRARTTTRKRRRRSKRRGRWRRKPIHYRRQH